VATPKTKQATYADIKVLPPNVVGEILFGVLRTQPRPASPHIGAASGLGMMLGGPFQMGRGGPGGWIIFDEPELHLGPHVVVPDLAGWRKERLAGKLDAKWIDVVPDWICEVLSDSTRGYDKRDKMRISATFGVPYLWHLDPASRVLEVFTLQGKDWLLVGTFWGTDLIVAPPFESLSFLLNELWPDEAPKPEN
jgi:hypothetical protein